MDCENFKMGERIKKLRRDRDLKQDDLGAILGLSRAQISNIENNRRGLSLNNLKLICEHFGVSMEFLGFNKRVVETSELLERTRIIFENEKINIKEKEELYEQVMRMYLNAKDQIKK